MSETESRAEIEVGEEIIETIEQNRTRRPQDINGPETERPGKGSDTGKYGMARGSTVGASTLTGHK